MLNIRLLRLLYMADVIAMLEQMRAASGDAVTIGLPDDVISDFASRDSSLRLAIEEGLSKQSEIAAFMLKQDETTLVSLLQEDFVNFYAPATVNPYVAISGRGPWIVTSHGAVIHDNGGYGMLGGGHGPGDIIEVMSQNHVMANAVSYTHLTLPTKA